MEITAAQVNDLRAKTGAGMMDCKKALVEAQGDVEKAVEILRKKGAAVAAKRADKAANEGLVLTKVSDDNKTASIVEINCETDFVAKSDDFTNFANFVIDSLFASKSKNVEEFLASAPAVTEKVNEITGKVGEKVVISRAATVSVDSGMVVNYVHPGSKLGVLVWVSDEKNTSMEGFSALGRDLAMQIAAMRPISVYREEVPKDIVEKEIEIYKELAKKEGKPENILNKIAEGRLNKFYEENCLFEQAFIKDNSKKISDLIKEYNSKYGAVVKIGSFLRYNPGDEKK